MIFISRTDDPHKDFDRWEAEQQRLLDSCPVCRKCKEPIQDYYAYKTELGWICEDCADDTCTDEEKVRVGDYIE